MNYKPINDGIVCACCLVGMLILINIYFKLDEILHVLLK